MVRKHSWFQSYDALKSILSSAKIPCQFFENLSMDVLNLCGNSQNLLLGTDAWVFAHPLLKTIPFDTELTLPFGVLHSRKPSAQVKKFLKIVDFVNVEYKNFGRRGGVNCRHPQINAPAVIPYHIEIYRSGFL